LSNVIKSEDLHGPGDASPVVFDLANVEARADRLVAEAEARAAEIADRSARDAERIREKAAEEGRREGFEKGLEDGRAAGAEEGRARAVEEGRAQMDALARSLQEALSEFSSARDDLFVKAEEDLLHLALLIAKKVIAREVEADKHVTVDNLKRCLEVLSGRRNVKVRVAPEVLETVESALPDFARAFGDMSSVSLEGDPQVSAGGCMITAGEGSLDATVETQLAEVEAVLFGKCDE